MDRAVAVVYDAPALLTVTPEHRPMSGVSRVSDEVTRTVGSFSITAPVNVPASQERTSAALPELNVKSVPAPIPAGAEAKVTY